MEKRYQGYLEGFGLAGEKPMSFEEFSAKMERKDKAKAEKEAAIAKITPEIEALYTITEMPRSTTEVQDMLTALRKAYKAQTAGESDRIVIAAHEAARNTAEALLSKIYNDLRRGIKPVSMTATNVYDDDNHPTSH